LSLGLEVGAQLIRLRKKAGPPPKEATRLSLNNALVFRPFFATGVAFSRFVVGLYKLHHYYKRAIVKGSGFSGASAEVSVEASVEGSVAAPSTVRVSAPQSCSTRPESR
jgi:hypothetical protein